MRLTINVDGQDVFVSDVLALMHMLSFHGKTTFSPKPGTVVVVHAESEKGRLTEQFVVTEDEEE